MDDWKDVPDPVNTASAVESDWKDVPDPVTTDGEFRNPVAKPWNLAPMTSGMLKASPFFAPLAPITGIADLARDTAVLGKTALQQPLARQDMPFSTRLRTNLQSEKSLGSEVADNYLPALAEKAVADGVDPEKAAAAMAVIHGALSNGVDIGAFFGTGGPEGIKQLFKGGENIVNRIRGMAPRVAPAPALKVEPNVIQQSAEAPQPGQVQYSAPGGKAAMDAAGVEPPLDIQGQQFNFADLGKNPAVRQRIKENPYESPLGPPRDPGQQEFDFTQGPVTTTPEVSTEGTAPLPAVLAAGEEPSPAKPTMMVQPNMIQLSAQIQKEIDQIARTPNAARSPAYRGLDKQQLQDMFVQRNSKPVVQLPPDPSIEFARPQMKDLKNPLNVADPYEMTAGEEDRIRREQLIRDRQSVDDLVKREEASPSAMADLKTILVEKNKRIGKKGAVGDLGPKAEMSPEERAALDRWKTTHGPAILKDFNRRAEDVTTWVMKHYPAASAAEHALMIQALNELKSGQKIGNLNLKQYPDEQKSQLKQLFAGQEDKLKTRPMTDDQITARAKELTSLPVTEPIIRNKEGQAAAEVRRRVMNDIATMKAVSEDKTLSAQEAIQKILQHGTTNTKKVKTEIGRALGAMNTPLEAQQEHLDAVRKIVDRLRADPTLGSAESRSLVGKLRQQFPELDENVTAAQIFKTVFRNFITSGPLTLGVNAISGYGNIAARPAMRTLEVTSAKLRSLLKGEPTTATYKEVGAMLKGMSDALGGSKLPDNLKAKTFSDKYNISPFATMAATAKTKAGRAALDVTDKVITAPEKVMRRTDEHVKNILGMMETYAAKARGEDVMTDQHAIDRITSAQSRLSFQDEMSGIGKWVAQGRNYFSHQRPTAFNQAGDILTYSVQPFIQTVDRIIAGGLNTALGPATLPIKALGGKYTGALAKGIKADPVAGEKLDRDMAAAMVAAPLFVWTGMQLANGNLQGSAPTASAGRDTFNNAGKTEFSFKVGDRWVPLRLLPEPLATAIQIHLAIHQGLAEAKDKGQSLNAGVLNAVTKTGYMLATKPYLGGMNSLINAVSAPKDSSSAAEPDILGSINENPLVKKILPSVAVPAVVKDIGVLKDTAQGRPRVMAETAMETTKRRAGFTKGMVPELNTFGEPVTHPMMGKVNKDPAYALAEKFPPQPVERTREGVKLSEQEYHDLKQSVGTQRKTVFETLAKNAAFMKAPKGVQQIIIEDMVSDADKIGTEPRKLKELQTDPLYYNRRLRTLLDIKRPGGERSFPFLK